MMFIKEKTGAVELSFGMIFSVIMIIAIIGITSYVIVYFINIGESTKIGLFYKDFQEEVNGVWNSAITNKEVSFDLPSEIDAVCFGNLKSNNFHRSYEIERNYINQYTSNFDKESKNIFLYPSDKAGELAFTKIEHIDLSDIGYEFTCFDVVNGKIKLRLVKNEFDSEVKIKR